MPLYIAHECETEQERLHCSVTMQSDPLQYLMRFISYTKAMLSRVYLGGIEE